MSAADICTNKNENIKNARKLLRNIKHYHNENEQLLQRNERKGNEMKQHNIFYHTSGGPRFSCRAGADVSAVDICTSKIVNIKHIKKLLRKIYSAKNNTAQRQQLTTSEHVQFFFYGHKNLPGRKFCVVSPGYVPRFTVLSLIPRNT